MKRNRLKAFFAAVIGNRTAPLTLFSERGLPKFATATRFCPSLHTFDFCRAKVKGNELVGKMYLLGCLHSSLGLPVNAQRRVSFSITPPPVPNTFPNVDFGQGANLVYTAKGLIVNAGLGARPTLGIDYIPAQLSKEIDTSNFNGLRLGVRARTNDLKGNITIHNVGTRASLGKDIVQTQISPNFWNTRNAIIEFPFANFISPGNRPKLDRTKVVFISIQITHNYRLGGHCFILDRIEFY